MLNSTYIHALLLGKRSFEILMTISDSLSAALSCDPFALKCIRALFDIAVETNIRIEIIKM